LFAEGVHCGAVGGHGSIDAGATTSNYDARRAAYDIRKLRGKELVSRVANSRRYCISPQAIRTIGKPKMGRKPKNWSPIDEHYEAVRQDMFTLSDDLRNAA
jgi:hypothetical protein